MWLDFFMNDSDVRLKFRLECEEQIAKVTVEWSLILVNRSDMGVKLAFLSKSLLADLTLLERLDFLMNTVEMISECLGASKASLACITLVGFGVLLFMHSCDVPFECIDPAE